MGDFDISNVTISPLEAISKIQKQNKWVIRNSVIFNNACSKSAHILSLETRIILFTIGLY